MVTGDIEAKCINEPWIIGKIYKQMEECRKRKIVRASVTLDFSYLVSIVYI